MEIIFDRISDSNSIHFEDFEHRYLEDFPREERRDIADLLNLLTARDTSIRLEGITHRGIFAGFISFWHLPHFIYIEHFAIHPNFRSQGLGKIVVNSFLERFPGESILLEVEPPTDPIAIRRIRFYECLGFELSDLPYTQPSYHGEREGIPLRIMTRNFSKGLSYHHIDELMREVYDISL